MLIFITALQCEAKPIIKQYKLKRDMCADGFMIYRGERIALIISGTGKMNAAIAVTFLLSNINSPLEDVLLCNWGCCASNDSNHKLGDVFVIHKIYDQDTGRDYYPDLPLSLEKTIPQNTICCRSKPFLIEEKTKDKKERSPSLFDMESAGVMASATKFLKSHQILLIKAISDHGISKRIDLDHLGQIMQDSFAIAAPWIEQAFENMYVPSPAPENKYKALTDQIVVSHNLTQTMNQQLSMAVRHAVNSSKDPQTILLQHKDIVIHSKIERKRAFEHLLHELKN